MHDFKKSDAQELTLAQARKLLNTGPGSKMETWPDKKGCLTLIEALDAGLKIVVIGSEAFKIRYDDDGTFFISPREGYTPCGHLTREGLEHRVT